MEPATLASVVEYHIETPRKRYYKLLLCAKGMPRAMCPAGNVVNPIGTCYVEWYRGPALYNREIAPPVAYRLQLYDMYLLETHISRMAKIHSFEQTAKNISHYSQRCQKFFCDTALHCATITRHQKASFSFTPGNIRYGISYQPDSNRHRLPLLKHVIYKTYSSHFRP